MKTRMMKLLDFLLDTLAPPDPMIRAIERMPVGDFVSEARRTAPLPESGEVISLLPYRSPIVRAALVELKERPNRRIVRLLGSLLAWSLAEEISDLNMFGAFVRPIIVPVPMTRRRRRERGWNQCELVVGEAAEMLRDLDVVEYRSDVLIKLRETDDQVGRTREERFENQHGALAVAKPEAVVGRDVIVFDDIVTTGATLEEARRALGSAGARRIACITLAH